MHTENNTILYKDWPVFQVLTNKLPCLDDLNIKIKTTTFFYIFLFLNLRIFCYNLLSVVGGYFKKPVKMVKNEIENLSIA